MGKEARGSGGWGWYGRLRGTGGRKKEASGEERLRGVVRRRGRG